MNRETFKQKYEEKHKANQELIESDHLAALFARNPEEALEYMQEEHNEEFSFTAGEVTTRIENLSKYQRDHEDGEIPVVDTIERKMVNKEPNNTYYVSSEPTRYVRACLKEAAETDEYGVVENDIGEPKFAYVGGLDLDFDT